MIKFNTAYNIAKEELPFTKFKSLITLMKKKGMDVNRHTPTTLPVRSSSE
jgi:hypothetical protein